MAKQFKKVIEKVDDGGKALIKDLLGDNPTRGFDLDSVYCINNQYYVIELLFCDVTKNPWPRDSHPSRYFIDDKRKFLSLWEITKRLDGRLILINYEATHSEYKLMEVSQCTEVGIQTKDDLVVNKEGMIRWFQALNNHDYLEILELNKDEYRIKCPQCGRSLVFRRGKEGRYKSFWGCSGYPECKTIIKTR